MPNTKSGSPSPSRSPAAIEFATSVSSAAVVGDSRYRRIERVRARAAVGRVVHIEPVALAGLIQVIQRLRADEVEVAIAFDVDQQDAARVASVPGGSIAIAAPKTMLFAVVVWFR